MSQWLDQTRALYCWISLDEEHNDLRVFLRYMVTAIERIFPELLGKTRSLLFASELPPIEMLSNTLINELDQAEHIFIVALDDFHIIHSEAIKELIKNLLLFPPQNMHLAILTRRDPSLKISSLRSHNRLTEIRTKDLSFSENEIVELVNKQSLTATGNETIRKLFTLTEGWIIGLRLALMTEKDGEIGLESLQNPEGNMDSIAAFLMEEVLKKQSNEIQLLLLKTSILDRFSRELMDEFIDDEDTKSRTTGGDFIQWLKISNLFLINLDIYEIWFRYHHLFQALLQQQLKLRFSKKEVASFHAIASKWYEKNGFIEEALDQILAAGDEKQAIKIIENHRQAVLNDDGWYILERWIKKVSPEVAHTSPIILLCNAWTLYYQLKLAAIPPFLEAAKALLDKGNHRQSLYGEISFFWGIFLYWGGQHGKSEALLLEATHLITEDYCQASGEAIMYWNLSRHALGKEEAALSDCNRILSRDVLMKAVFESRILGGLMHMSLISGDLSTTLMLAPRLGKMGKESAYVKAFMPYFTGYVHYSWNDMEAAVIQFEQVRENRYIFFTRAAIDAYALLVLTYQALQRIDRANEMMEEFLEFAKETEDESYMSIAQSCKAHLSILRGDLESAKLCQQSMDLSLDGGIMFYWAEIPRITHCRVLVEDGAVESLGKAEEYLKGTGFFESET